MAKFLVLKKGAGDGCDYTIGCNMRYDVNEWTGDLKSFIAHIADEEADEGELHTVELIVVPIDNAIYVPLDKIRAERKERAMALKASATEAKERAEFEKLKKKFG